MADVHRIPIELIDQKFVFVTLSTHSVFVAPLISNSKVFWLHKDGWKQLTKEEAEGPTVSIRFAELDEEFQVLFWLALMEGQ